MARRPPGTIAAFAIWSIVWVPIPGTEDQTGRPRRFSFPVLGPLFLFVRTKNPARWGSKGGANQVVDARIAPWAKATIGFEWNIPRI
jgi:hypothetical protein